ncbi:MAG: ABC transporter substrate-binding protein [Merismopedia sp. SIO2A8]|nr:ABC transporter substrate-binding protein [Merismopedia sp. SIO2A8]
MAIALLVLATACQPTNTSTSEPVSSDSSAPSSSPSGNSDSGLKIGSLLPITGDLAQYGGPMQDAASLLVDTVNACGGVLGASVELISEDNQTEPSAGASAMTKLTEVDQVTGVVGAAASSVSSASVDIAVRNSVVQISPASTSPVFTDRAKAGDFDGFWFRTAPPDTFQGVALANLAQSKGLTNVAVLAINNDYGNGLVASFSTAYQALGGTIVNGDDPTFYAPDATTFDSEVITAFSSNPDAVMIVAYPETGSLILKAAFEQGLLDGNTQLLLTDGMKDDSIPELVGKTTDGSYIVNGIIGTAPSAGGPALDRFTQLYKSAFSDRDPGVFDPNTWDAAAVLTLAAEAAQSTDGNVVKAAIADVANAPGTEVTDVCEGLELVRAGEDINYQGASGTIEFDAQGDVVGRYDVWTFTDDGTLEILETVDAGG